MKAIFSSSIEHSVIPENISKDLLHFEMKF